jgi:hypothetical protein
MHTLDIIDEIFMDIFWQFVDRGYFDGVRFW